MSAALLAKAHFVRFRLEVSEDNTLALIAALKSTSPAELNMTDAMYTAVTSEPSNPLLTFAYDAGALAYVGVARAAAAGVELGQGSGAAVQAQIIAATETGFAGASGDVTLSRTGDPRGQKVGMDNFLTDKFVEVGHASDPGTIDAITWADGKGKPPVDPW